MKSLRASSPKAQRGSIYTTMILVALFALVILAALKITPAYIDDSTIVGTLEGITEREDFDTMNISEIRQSLMRTLNTNRIEFDPSQVVIVKDGGKEYLDVNYESRKPLFYNIEAVMVFSHRLEKN